MRVIWGISCDLLTFMVLKEEAYDILYDQNQCISLSMLLPFV